MKQTIVFNLLMIGFVLTQGNQVFGGQPTLGNQPPNMTMNMFQSGVNQFNSQTPFPNCSDIQSIGSPILLLSQIELIVTNQMKVQNQNSFVKYLYHEIIPTSDSNTNIYSLVFSLVDNIHTYYLGMALEVTGNGLTSVKIAKFILNVDLAKVKIVLKPLSPNVMTLLGGNSIQCGDLKMIFSSYGNSPNSALPGANLQGNRNAPTLTFIKNALVEMNLPGNDCDRDCSPDHIVQSQLFFPQCYNDSGFVCYYPEPPQSLEELNNGISYTSYETFETAVSCNPDKNKPTVQSITAYYTYDVTETEQNNPNCNNVLGLEIRFYSQSGSSVESKLIGKKGDDWNGPVSTYTINLQGAESVAFYYSELLKASIGIVTLDKNDEIISEVYCGVDWWYTPRQSATDLLDPDTTDVVPDIVPVINLQGFWIGTLTNGDPSWSGNDDYPVIGAFGAYVYQE